MEASRHRAGFVGRFEDIGGVRAAAMNDTLSFVPSYLRGYFRDGVVGRGEEHEVGFVGYFLVAFEEVQVADDFAGRAARVPRGRADELIAFLAEEYSQGSPYGSGPDKPYFHFRALKTKTLSDCVREGKIPGFLFAVSVVSDPSDLVC
jgi:hypothetical protein